MGKHRNPRKLIEDPSPNTLAQRRRRETAKGKAATERAEERRKAKNAYMDTWLKETEAGKAYVERHRIYRRQYYQEKREQIRASAKRTADSQRLEGLVHYGNGEAICACCGESEFEFLQLDHINGDGAAHRRQLKEELGYVPNGNVMTSWLKKHGWPEGFQVLCANCNYAKRVDKICPHERRRREAQANNEN